MEYEDVLTNQPVVIDNGSGVIKADFAGAVEGNVFIERKAQELRGLIKIKYPIEHGIVSIWKYIYEEELKTAPEEHPVLLTEAPFNLRNNKILLHKCFLNVQSPALFTSIQAVLSLYSSGRTTGIVLDSGDGVTHAVPVYEEFSLPYAIRRIDIAGRYVMPDELLFALSERMPDEPRDLVACCRTVVPPIVRMNLIDLARLISDSKRSKVLLSSIYDQPAQPNEIDDQTKKESTLMDGVEFNEASSILIEMITDTTNMDEDSSSKDISKHISERSMLFGNYLDEVDIQNENMELVKKIESSFDFSLPIPKKITYPNQ
ncbi:13468_t:CDS:2 [Entrophospora sp. SA101]|nr:13468_t:CDS:2 [Entrophospora sp. SA101]